MKCKISDKLSKYIDNELEKEEKEDLEAHISVCEYCKKEYKELVKVNEMILSIDEMDCPDFLYDNVIKQIQAEKIIEFPSRERLKIKILPIAASFLISFLIGTILSISTFKESTNETNDLTFGSESFAYYFEGAE